MIEEKKYKLFGPLADRITKYELSLINSYLLSHLTPFFSRVEVPKNLESKLDFGDVDVVVQINENNLISIDNRLYNIFGKNIIKTHKNGPIYSILFNAEFINKQVHVDFIFASPEEYDSNLMYINYSDFSGILGVIARRLKFNYGNKGIFKIYVDKKGQNHYILLSHNLVDGLRMLGYGDIINNYYNIQTNDDIVKFIGYSDLFDSNYLVGSDLNRGDRKRLRSSRPTARECRNKLIELNKSRNQPDDDYYLKNLFSDQYSEYLLKCKAIEDYVPPKSKYNGHWLINNFGIKPGPIIKKIQLYWLELYGNDIDSVDEERIRIDTYSFIKNNTIEV